MNQTCTCKTWRPRGNSHEPALIPAQCFPARDFIKDELEARGWSHEHLAETLGCHVSVVDGILSGMYRLTPFRAQGIAKAFGTTTMMLLGLDSYYWDWRDRHCNQQLAKKT